VDSEGGAVRYGSVFAKEDNIIDTLSGGFLPTGIQIILHHNTSVMLQQSHSSIYETPHTLHQSIAWPN